MAEATARRAPCPRRMSSASRRVSSPRTWATTRLRSSSTSTSAVPHRRRRPVEQRAGRCARSTQLMRRRGRESPDGRAARGARVGERGGRRRAAGPARDRRRGGGRRGGDGGEVQEARFAPAPPRAPEHVSNHHHPPRHHKGVHERHGHPGQPREVHDLVAPHGLVARAAVDRPDRVGVVAGEARRGAVLRERVHDRAGVGAPSAHGVRRQDGALLAATGSENHRPSPGPPRRSGAA